MKPTTGYIVRSYISKIDDSEQPFALWVPHSYSRRKKYPLLVALHGMISDHRMIPEECFRIHERGFREDMIALFPFGRGDVAFEWVAEADVWDTINWVKGHYRIDTRRQYLTGLSMGGFAAWRLGCQYPDQWAALAPVCGGGDPNRVSAMKDVPVWCVHGEHDPLVSVEYSRQMVTALRRLSAQVRYDELPGWEHNSWEWLYNPVRIHDSLAEFCLRHRKRHVPRSITIPARRQSLKDVFHERVIISYPAERISPRERKILKTEAERIARFSFGDYVMRTGRLLVKADTELALADLRGTNHLMLGQVGNHRWLRSAKRNLRVQATKNGLRFAEATFGAKGHVAAVLQPSPWNRRKLLGVVTYNQFQSLHGISEQLFHIDVILRNANVLDASERRFVLQTD